MVAPQSVHDGSDPCRDGHALRWLRPLRGVGPAGLDCDKPVLWVCRHCDESDIRRCNAHRESACLPCAGRYRRRVRKVAQSGCGRETGFTYFVTVTAPSETHYMPSGDECPCGVRDFDLAKWNASHSRRWNHFRTILRREGSDKIEFFRGIEDQKRGALHDHVMVWSPVPLTKQGLKGLALRAGFGHSIDVVRVVPGSRKAAYYVSKYITKATDNRQLVPWWGDKIDYETGEVTEGLVEARYRTWSMSRGWGLTMAAVRAEGLAYVKILEEKSAVQGLANVWATFPDLVLISESPPAPS